MANPSFRRRHSNATILRPAYFIENYAPVLGAATGGGVLPSFFPADFRFSMNARSTSDASPPTFCCTPLRVSASSRWKVPAQYSPADIAPRLTTLLAKPVNVLELPLWTQSYLEFTKLGFTEDAAKLFAEMYAGLLSGHVAPPATGELRKGTVTPQEVLAGLLKTAPAHR